MNFTAFQHSPFLQSLGWAIANSFWQAALLWVLYMAVNNSYKNATSKFKNNVSTVFLFSSFAWFIATFCHKLYYLKETIKPVVLTESQFNAFAQYLKQRGLTSNEIRWQNVIAFIEKTLPYLSIAYILLLVALSARLVSAYRQASFIRTHGLQKPGVEWRLFAEKVANHIGIKKSIRIWISEHVDVPATIGFLKPVILLPLASVNQLSTDQLEAIILHELAHIKRNDYLVNLIIAIIETILFFNPFVVLLARIIRKERENCCDDFVIQYQYDPHAYASALLSIEQSRTQQLRLAMAATSDKKMLFDRIKRIMEVNSKSRNFNYGQRLIALLLITGIFCSIAWLTPSKSETESASITGSNKLIVKKDVPVKDQIRRKATYSPNQAQWPGEPVVASDNIQHSRPIPGTQVRTITIKDPKDDSITQVSFTRANSMPPLKSIKYNFKAPKPAKTEALLMEPPAPPAKPRQEINGNQWSEYLPENDKAALQKDLEAAQNEIAAVDWKKVSGDITKSLGEIEWNKVVKNVMNNPQLKAKGQAAMKQLLNKTTREINLAKEQVAKEAEMIRRESNRFTFTRVAPVKLKGNLMKTVTVPPAPPVVNQGGPSFEPDIQLNLNDDPDFVKLKSPGFNISYGSKGSDEAEEVKARTDKKTPVKNRKLNIEWKEGNIYINGKKIRSPQALNFNYSVSTNNCVVSEGGNKVIIEN